MTFQKSWLKVYLFFGVHIIHDYTVVFPAFYTQLCILYKGAYYTQDFMVLTYSMFYNFSILCRFLFIIESMREITVC